MRRLERLIDGASDRVLAWAARHAEPARVPWIEAVHGELELVDGAPARLLWALGGLSVVCSTRRSTVTRFWRSLPAPIRFSLFGVTLAVALVIAVVWSNVIVPSHESDDEYTGWYLAFYLGLFAYFGVSGFLAARGGASRGGATLTGLVTAVIGVGVTLVTFVVIDNLFLDVVMQQPDKAAGFAHSGLTSAREYVNQGNLLGFVTVMPVVAAIGAGFGLAGGLLAQRLDPGPAAAAWKGGGPPGRGAPCDRWA